MHAKAFNQLAIAMQHPPKTGVLEIWSIISHNWGLTGVPLPFSPGLLCDCHQLNGQLSHGGLRWPRSHLAVVSLTAWCWLSASMPLFSFVWPPVFQKLDQLCQFPYRAESGQHSKRTQSLAFFWSPLKCPIYKEVSLDCPVNYILHQNWRSFSYHFLFLYCYGIQGSIMIQCVISKVSLSGFEKLQRDRLCDIEQIT